MARVEVCQNRGFTLGCNAPFIDSPNKVTMGSLQVASGWSFEHRGDVAIRCVQGGAVLLCGDPSIELELKTKRVQYEKKSGYFSITMDGGRELKLASRLAVFAEEIKIASPSDGVPLWCVVVCMGRLDHLKRTAPRLIEQKNCRYILVDWSCPDKCGDWVEANFESAIVLRAPGRSLLNLSAARNMGSESVPAGGWACFIDCDVLAHKTFCERMISRRSLGSYVWPSGGRNLHTYGTFMINKDDLISVGGFDEVIDTWGNEDYALFKILNSLGMRRVDPKFDPLLNHIRHGDERSVRYSRIKDKRKSSLSTQRYVDACIKMVCRLGRPLTVDERVELRSRSSL